MRKRITQADKRVLEAQIIDELKAHHPQSVRHMYYMMTNPRLEVHIDKDEKGYKKIQQMLVDMRRAEKIPFSAIADSSRSGTCGDYEGGYESPEDFIENMGYGYSKAFWLDHDYHVQVWCESRSLAGTLSEVCRRYTISLDACVGFASDSQIYRASERMKDELKKGKHVVVIYIGDYDPSGVLIDKDLHSKLMHFIGGGKWLDYDKNKKHSELCEEYEDLYNFSFWRIAITEKQIEEYDLPTKPRKKGEKRMPDITETVEAEAMPVDDMRELLESWINKIVTEDDFKIHRKAYKSEAEGLKAFADARLKGYAEFKKKRDGEWDALTEDEKWNLLTDDEKEEKDMLRWLDEEAVY